MTPFERYVVERGDDRYVRQPWLLSQFLPPGELGVRADVEKARGMPSEVLAWFRDGDDLRGLRVIAHPGAVGPPTVPVPMIAARTGLGSRRRRAPVAVRAADLDLRHQRESDAVGGGLGFSRADRAGLTAPA